MSAERIDETTRNDGRECPYCGHLSHVECESYSDRVRVEECEECGKKYHAREEFTVDHHAKPDCALNDEPHEWGRITGLVRGLDEVCARCGEIRQTKEPEG